MAETLVVKRPGWYCPQEIPGLSKRMAVIGLLPRVHLLSHIAKVQSSIALKQWPREEREAQKKNKCQREETHCN